MVGIRYELSRPDFLAMRRVLFPWYKNWAGWILFGILGIICVGVGVFARLDRTSSVSGWWVLPSLYVVSIVGAFFERWWKREKAWRVAQAVGQITAEFTEAGLGIAAGTERAFSGWQGFTHYRETAELLLIYRGKKYFRYFPNSAFEGNEAAIAEVRRLLHTHVRLTRFEHRPTAQAGFPVELPVAQPTPPSHNK